MDIVFEVLKWVVVILIAGFIGQFGKSMSLHFIDSYKRRRRKDRVPSPADQGMAERDTVVPPGEGEFDREREVVDTSPKSRPEPKPAGYTQGPSGNGGNDKKANKNQLKLEKKRAKARTKAGKD